MAALDLVLTDAPTEADKGVVLDGLVAFNLVFSDYHDRRPLAVLARDPVSGETVGGMIGHTSIGLLFIDLVYLPATQRGQNLGGRMLAMMEQEAVRRGCRSATLMTITFQAPGFYERHGWREFGRVPCDPPGTFRVFMAKMLAGV